MSYDVYVGDYDRNVSFNGRDTFQLVLPPVEGGHDLIRERGGLWALDGLTGRQAADAIAHGLIHVVPGWRMGPFLPFLKELHLACLAHPRCKVRVYG